MRGYELKKSRDRERGGCLKKGRCVTEVSSGSGEVVISEGPWMGYRLMQIYDRAEALF